MPSFLSSSVFIAVICINAVLPLVCLSHLSSSSVVKVKVIWLKFYPSGNTWSCSTSSWIHTLFLCFPVYLYLIYMCVFLSSQFVYIVIFLLILICKCNSYYLPVLLGWGISSSAALPEVSSIEVPPPPSHQNGASKDRECRLLYRW